MKDEIYKDLLIYHWKNPKNYGSIKNPDKEATLENHFCGDKIRIGVKTKDRKIDKIKFSGEGCIISLATASLLTEAVKGKRVSEVKKLNKDFVLGLLGIKLGPIRLKCALLPLLALKKAIED